MNGRAVGLMVAILAAMPVIQVGAQRDDRVVRLLAELTNAHGAPGFEGPVRNILRRE
jgi:hypothetical protein